MIQFFFEKPFNFLNRKALKAWLNSVIHDEGKFVGDINYIFCDDDGLLERNIKYLKHNTLTDIISFDYSEQGVVSGDIFISVDRVKENAKELGIVFSNELHRVMVHGVLHFCGYKDKTQAQKLEMRKKEDYCLSLRTF